MTIESQQLLCPRDGSELEIRRWKDSEFGFCTRCHGMRIERSELEALCRYSEGPLLSYPADPSDGVEVEEGPTLCSCPGQPLMDRATKEDGLSIDICPVCHALWFDAGEVQCYLAARKDRTPESLGPAKSLPRALGELSLETIFGFAVANVPLLDLLFGFGVVPAEDRSADPRAVEREDP